MVKPLAAIGVAAGKPLPRVSKDRDDRLNMASSSMSQATVDADLEKILAKESSSFQRDVEVERILKSFKLKCVCHVYPTDISCADVLA